MKILGNIILFLITLQVPSQSLECCKNVEQVKQILEGDWILEATNKSNIYRFRFNASMGFVEVLEELNLPPKAENTVIENSYNIKMAQVNIGTKDGEFFIELVYDSDTIKEKIKLLDEDHFVFGSGSSVKTFFRDKSKL